MQGRGYVVDSWDRMDPYHLLGVKPAGAIPAEAVREGSLSAASVSTIEASSNKPWHPDSPLFWFGTLLAVTLGFIGASTAVRVGPFKAGLAAGKT